LCLHRLGVKAAGLNVHECGLHSPEGIGCASAVTVRAETLRRYLDHYAVVVIPGFFATGPHDSVVSLGRGASDLTAVLLAAALGAERCELVKDVPGYFDKDPNRHADATPLTHITFDRALEMAAEGCDLVQTAALEAGRRQGCPIVVRSLDADGLATAVADGFGVTVPAAPRTELSNASVPYRWRRIGA
jgi:aspartate kinase